MILDKSALSEQAKALIGYHPTKGVRIQNYFMPTADGAAGKIICTDGAGTLGWAAHTHVSVLCGTCGSTNVVCCVSGSCGYAFCSASCCSALTGLSAMTDYFVTSIDFMAQTYTTSSAVVSISCYTSSFVSYLSSAYFLCSFFVGCTVAYIASGTTSVVADIA